MSNSCFGGRASFLFGLMIALMPPGTNAAEPAPLFEQKPIQLIANDWCPQHCEFDVDNKGFIIDIVEQALQEQNAAFKISYKPWLRALREVEEGWSDGLLTPTVEGYHQFLFHQLAVGYQQYCFYINSDTQWRYTKPDDLLGMRLAHLKESGFGELEGYLDKNREAIQIEEFAGGEKFTSNIFKFLFARRADVIIMTSDVYEYGVKRGEISDHFLSAGCLANEKLAVGLNRHNEMRSRQIADALDCGIHKLRVTGRLKAILDKYGITLWPAEAGSFQSSKGC